jgi:hypothetical protein
LKSGNVPHIILSYDILILVFCIIGPTLLKRYEGENALFLWNTTDNKKIMLVGWGLRKGNHAYPWFISVNSYDRKVNFNLDMDPRYIGRVKFIGNLTVGHAWFVITNLNINDTNEYIASISDNAKRVIPYPVRLEVKERAGEFIHC